MRRHLLPVVVLLTEIAMLLAGGRAEVRPWAVVGHAVLVALVLLVRRPAPIAALIAALLLVALSDAGYVVLLWAAYQAGRELLTRTGTGMLAGALSGALAVEVLTSPDHPRTIPNLVSTYLVFAVLPVLVGRYLAQHERLVATLDRHNRQLRRERELLAEQGQLRERLRIARDMHDSLGHRLSLVSVQAAALEVAELPPVQRQAVRQLAGAARGALDELYELVGALRGGPGAELRSPGPEGIGPLVAEFRAAGMPVTLHQGGTPGTLAGTAGQAAFRVVEEGLTNALKHAPGQPVTVRLQWEPDALLLTLDNPLPAGTAVGTGPAAVPGHGLAGLRERADQAGGFAAYSIVEADPADDPAGGGDDPTDPGADPTGGADDPTDPGADPTGGADEPAGAGRGWRLFAMLPVSEEPADADDGLPAPPRIRTLALGLATGAVMFVAMPASMLLGVR